MPQSILKVISAWAAITHNSRLMAEISCRLCTTNDDTHLFGLLKIRKVNLTSSSCWSLPLPCISLPKSVLSKEWWENIAPWIFNSPFTHLFSIKFQFWGNKWSMISQPTDQCLLHHHCHLLGFITKKWRGRKNSEKTSHLNNFTALHSPFLNNINCFVRNCEDDNGNCHWHFDTISGQTTRKATNNQLMANVKLS